MYINRLSGTSEAVHALRARASLTRLCMRCSLADVLERLDDKSNRHDGRQGGWPFLILASRSIMGRTSVWKRGH
jgi:hypothetical protein